MSAARPGIRYIPALDGLRALAVMGVLLYHHDEIGMFRGGYVGVDVFFVISGYLITSLLITEFRGRGRVSLTTFYVRRAKRLLPAMLLVVAVSSIVAATVAREFAVSVRGDAIASLFYVNNWWQLSSSQPYGQAFAGHLPLLQHLWSLAIEEQFYLLWPIVVIIGLRWAHGKPGRLRQFALTVLGLGVVSGIAMWVAYSPADPSAIYYPTHLHAFGLLFGSVLAMGWRQHRLRADIAFSAKALLNAIALFGLAVLYWVMTSKTYDFYGDNLHRSLLISSLVSVLIVGAIVHPAGGMVSSVLSWRPFTWIGERSYGIYLWHILVFYFVDTEIPLVPKLPSLVLGSLRIIITVVIAHFSYELLESPIRYGRLGDAYRTYRSLRGPRKSRLRRTIFVAASVVVVTLSA
ncbi:MAG: acyltransferase, partial [Acidimicrobiia bacterium]